MTVVGFGAVLLLTGCPPGSMRNQGIPTRLPSDSVTAAQLVSLLNDNSRRLQTLECRNVDIDAQQGHQPVGLQGAMICQQKRNFRLNARVVGQPAVDIGSNNEEFWWWISKGSPYLFHCSYTDLERGNVRLGFPLQPEWVMEALGMGQYDPNGEYEVRPTKTTYELVQKTLSPQRQPVRKITVFARGPVAAGKPQVMAHRLEDAQGKEICSATIMSVQHDPTSGAVLPKQIKLVFPPTPPAQPELVTMTLRLDGVRVNGAIDPGRVQALFTRPRWENAPPYDVARGAPDAPVGQSQLQRVGGPQTR
jgi:hypothetical protein